MCSGGFADERGDSAKKNQNHAKTLRQGNVQTSASGRERIPASQTLAPYRHPIRQRAASFLAAVHIRCIALWAAIS